MLPRMYGLLIHRYRGPPSLTREGLRMPSLDVESTCEIRDTFVVIFFREEIYNSAPYIVIQYVANVYFHHCADLVGLFVKF